MWPMLLTLWLTLSGNAPPRPASRRRPAFRRQSLRPSLEALEGRCVPNAGYLDPTFGAAGAGLVTTPIGAINNTINNEIGQRVLIQSDGKVLAVGGSALARYNTDGSLDTSFGSGGIANFGGNSAALLSDGQILLAGGGGASGFSLMRLNSNGSLDTSFGNQGVVRTSFPSTTGEPQIVVQPDGKIVLATGAGVQAGKYVAAFDLARYNADGSLDTSFGNRGTVVTSFSNFNFSGVVLGVQSLLLQPNGELIVAADLDIPGGPPSLMARYNTNGSLDTSFGNQGVVTATWCGYVGGAVLYPTTGSANNGKIAVVGYNSSLSEPVLARFNTNGSLDTTFGSGGFVPLAMYPFGVAFDSSGRFVVGGMNEVALERLNPDGTPDTTFGSDGVVTTGLSGTHGDGLAIYPSTGTDTADYGKIAVVGGPGSLAGDGFMTARFLPSAPPSAPSFVVTAVSSATAGVPFSVTVTATDANGNVLTNYAGTVDFADLASLDPQAVLPADYTFTAADQGVHTFTVTFYKAAAQALFVADTTTPTMNGRQVSIQVNPGPVAHLVFNGPPTSIKRGTAFALYAEALDAYGNATSFNDTVHFSSSDPNATLPADETYPGNFTWLGTFILRTKGTQTITMTDVNDPSLSVTITIQVT
jgi:uncharacterized delta-60 repeat protein